MYGQIFKDSVGRSVTEYQNLIEVEKAAEVYRKEHLDVISIESPLVTKTGNVFRYVAGLFDKLDKRIDGYLHIAK